MDFRPLNLFPFEVSSVSFGMALDEVLFEETEATGNGFLRLSVFNSRCVTLGYFQTALNRDMSDLNWTRRPTGGGVVEHQNDLILSLAHPALKGKNSASLVYQQVHLAVLQALDATLSNLSLTLAGKNKSCCEKANQSYCFSFPVQYDICRPQGKIVGGALGKKRHSFLYQGSIQIKELFLDSIMRNAFQIHLETALAHIFEVVFERKTISEEKRSRAVGLEKSKYLSPVWKGKY